MNMETTKIDMRSGHSGSPTATNKQPLSSTKSIDEGFESDPDREQSTDSEQHSLLPIDSVTAAAATVGHATSTNTFDVVQSTDRDGMHHTQIARRSLNNGSNSQHYHNTNHHMHHMMDKDGRPNIAPKINPKVTIPRAGGTLNHPVRVATPLNHPPPSMYNTYRRSQVKERPALSIGHEMKTPRSLSAETVRIRTGVLPTNSAQRYPKGGNGNSNQHYVGSQYHALSPVLQNSSSLYTFYPAEGNISLYPSQYGLRYRSSHLNVEEQAPIMWTQSIPRHSKR